MAGGSYLVARKIRMTIETWDHASLNEQQRVDRPRQGRGGPALGRHGVLGPRLRRAVVDRVGPADRRRLARRARAPRSQRRRQLLRRGYNFVDGNDDLGRLNAGLFFIVLPARPATRSSSRSRDALAANDAMNEYVKHVGVGHLRGAARASRGGYVGETLFA